MSKKVESLDGEEWARMSFTKDTRTKDYFISNQGRLKSVDKRSGNIDAKFTDKKRIP